MDPQLSIIIPCFNEEAVIGLCLTSIIERMRNVDYEIVVVDNGSTDNTKSIALGFSGVRVYSIPRQTISSARNCGKNHSLGSLLAFIDADIVVTQQWADSLPELVASAIDKWSYVGGAPYRVRGNASLIEKAWFSTILLVPAKYLSGGNIVIARQAFDKVGGFDEYLQTGEDVEFCERVVRSGLKVAFDPRLEVIHLGYPATIGHFFRRESWHGIGDFQTFGLFLHSKVAMAAVLFFMSALAAGYLFAVGSYRGALMFAMLHFSLPMLFSLYKFKLVNRHYLLVQYFLSHVYLWARMYSLVRRVIERKRV